MRTFPAYPKRPHASGQARVRIQGKDVYLGVWNSAESRREYARLAALHAADPEAPPRPHARLTVSEVLARWTLHMKREYPERSREPEEYRWLCVVIERICGELPVEEFDAKALRTIRDAMGSGSWMTPEEKEKRLDAKHPVGWCRNRVGRQLSRARSVWRWAEEEGLVPKGSYEHLKALRPQRSGGQARDTEPRRPVEWDDVKAALAHLPPVVAAMVQLQWWTGMRPGEACRMRADEVGEGDGVWTYTIPRDEHKTGHRTGQARTIQIGANGRAVLGPWLDAARQIGPDAVVFPPGPRTGGKTYTRHSYRVAVYRACRRAGVGHWSPYQLRHAFRDRITRDLGLDHARAAMGHTSLGTTNLYGTRADQKIAGDAARRAG